MLLLCIFDVIVEYPYIQMMNKGKQEDGRGVNWSGQIWQTRLHMAFLIANIQVFLIVSCGPQPDLILWLVHQSPISIFIKPAFRQLFVIIVAQITNPLIGNWYFI